MDQPPPAAEASPPFDGPAPEAVMGRPSPPAVVMRALDVAGESVCASTVATAQRDVAARAMQNFRRVIMPIAMARAHLARHSLPAKVSARVDDTYRHP